MSELRALFRRTNEERPDERASAAEPAPQATRETSPAAPRTQESNETGRQSTTSRTAAAAGEPTASAAGGQAAPRGGLTATRTAAEEPGPPGPDDDAQGAGSGTNKPVLAGAAIVGAVLITVPLLLVGSNNKHREESPATTVAASEADTVMDGEDHSDQGHFVAQNPSPTPTPSESKTAKPAADAGSAKKSSPSAKPSASSSPEKHKAAPPPAAAPPAPKGPDLTHTLIRNTENGTCLTLPENTSGSQRQAACSTSDKSQRWTFEKSSVKGPNGHNLYVIRNDKNNLCVDLQDNGAAKASSKVGEFHCDKTTHDNQLFWIDKQPDKSFFIRNYASKQMCIDVAGFQDPQPGLGMTVFPCNGTDDHSWTFTKS
ncbi:RICIN domain-containing protein [Streptomyces sp. R1]|uniref:RICIN domain-containing protein n=1 Tax=Streptomyces sp. R1 TaxID=1509279 RepID=UPI001E47EBCF|nr:RICIN domain-containing protein [Streptomyces sp. R1]MCC8338936.1 RICIN domain-containing protein [Streptomyces sp. R1]